MKDESAQILLKGTPGSSGSASGRVRIARGLSDLDHLLEGEVLVVEHSSPAWTIGMLKAGGIIAASGGIICHAAIVAREMGIPAIVGAAGALAELSDGQLVTINGDDGTVRDAG